MLTTEPTGSRPATNQAAVAATGRSAGKQPAPLESPATGALAASFGDTDSPRVLRDDHSCS